ncbi:MAG: GHMP kinase [Hyphomicrobium sp.]|nr:GHMP kinase [Hyphomicrobium sp.]
MRPTTATLTSVRVSAPARLHLGFLDMNGALGRRFGSIGMAVDQPATRLSATRANTNSATGAESTRVLKLIQMFAKGSGTGFAIDVAEAIPAHAGLGSGTQLALAVGTAIARLQGRELGRDELADTGERGMRSGIGLAAFDGGGFLIDGGRGPSDRAPPVILRSDFPDDWRVLLVLDPSRAGVSGDAEKTAFATLPEFPQTAAAHICHLVLMKLVPGLKEKDIAAFGEALTEIQQLVGTHFAPRQGGSPWTSPAVGRIAKRMQDQGATGIGQSSWGPTGFAFVDSDEAASRLYHSLVEAAKADGVEIVIARGRNSGARIETT